MTGPAVNVITTAAGKLRPVCEFCGRRGRAVDPDGRGRVSVLDLARGWSVAPFPVDHVHADGSTGDQFSCPSCNRRLDRGEGVRVRAYLAHDERCQDWPLCGHDEAAGCAEHAAITRAVERSQAALRERGAMPPTS